MLSKSLLEERAQRTDLSGGEWQKIAIARLMMRDADFLMLDEPTASLDVIAEHEIYTNFAQLAQDKATLIISHRLATVGVADTIVVLEDGVIVERGSHLQLITAKGKYSMLYELQASQYNASSNS